MIEEYLLQVWSSQLLQYRSYAQSKNFFLKMHEVGPFLKSAHIIIVK